MRIVITFKLSLGLDSKCQFLIGGVANKMEDLAINSRWCCKQTLNFLNPNLKFLILILYSVSRPYIIENSNVIKMSHLRLDIQCRRQMTHAITLELLFDLVTFSYITYLYWALDEPLEFIILKLMYRAQKIEELLNLYINISFEYRPTYFTCS